MATPEDAPPIASPSSLRRFWLGARKNIARAYAAFIMAIILYLTFSAVWYLITSLAKSKTPAQITDVPAKLDRSVLSTDRAAWRGFEASENPRTPLAHYHRLDSWIQPDKFNGCTQSGCHAPLPHSKRKEVRAFLNMHATSIQCGVCHMQCEQRPLSLVWYDLADSHPRKSPAILEAYGLLMAMKQPPSEDAAAANFQEQLVKLLRKTANETSDNGPINLLADHLEAVRATSDAFRKLIDTGREMLPRHFRGEYGAKIALQDPKSGGPILAHPNSDAAVKAFLARGDSAIGDDRKQLLAAVHPLKREKALHCTDCHTADGGLVNFTRTGYPQARADALVNPVIFRMIEHINTGREMHLPEIVKPGAQPTSRP